MGIVIESDGVATPRAGTTLVPLRKQKLITEWDRAVFDMMDERCWPSQGAPTLASQLLDLSGVYDRVPAAADNMTFAGTAATFNGGMILLPGVTSRMDYPVACKPATTSNGYIHMAWLRLQETANVARVHGWGTTGSWAYGMYCNGVSRQYSTYSDGGQATVNLTAAEYPTDTAGVKSGLFLVCQGRAQDGAGGFLRKMRIYSAATGLKVNSSVAAGATAAQSTGAARFGYTGEMAANNPIEQRLFRLRHLDVQAVGGVATAAWWDAICDAEFANAPRAGWNLA